MRRETAVSVDAVIAADGHGVDLTIDVTEGPPVRVTKTASGPPEAHGDLRLVRGWLGLDITARSHVGDYDVLVQLAGTAEKPVLTLASEPPLAQSDVLAVLLFGVPAQDLGRGQQTGLAVRAAGLASSYVASGLTRSVRDTLGLDVFDVVLGEGSKRGEVRVGRYVTKGVFLSLAQEFGMRVGQAAIEYRVRPSMSVRLSTSTSGSSGIDVLWHRRY